eukprot:Gb_03246 [translate_table: standard]
MMAFYFLKVLCKKYAVYKTMGMRTYSSAMISKKSAAIVAKPPESYFTDASRVAVGSNLFCTAGYGDVLGQGQETSALTVRAQGPCQVINAELIPSLQVEDLRMAMHHFEDLDMIGFI